MDALRVVALPAPRSVRIGKGTAAPAVFIFQKSNGFFFGVKLLKMKIDTIFSV